MSQPEEKSKHSFETEQEKKDYINQVWDKVQKKEEIRGVVKKSCLVVSVITAMILLIVFKDLLPKWLTEVRGVGRGRHIPLLLYGSIIGLLVGEILSRILTKLMKLEE